MTTRPAVSASSVARTEPLLNRLRARCFEHRSMLTPILLALMCAPIWFSLGDHGFNGRSDARYAVIAQDMARSGDWIVPTYMGQAHLTKPPLVYWLEAGSIRLLGHSYLAVRLPSAICGTLVIFVLYWLVRRMLGGRDALFACGLYAIMPMTIFPARMSVTDSVLNLCWLLVLCGGWLARTEPRRLRWSVLMWGGASAGMLAKGPVMLIPLGLVALWWALSAEQRFSARALVRFKLALGLAMLPTLAWTAAVLVSRPEAVGVWWHETFDRVTGSGDHARPLWFFVPVLLIGCFPCSAMLLLPGLNLRWRRAWEHLRLGDSAGYLGLMVAGPFVLFSLFSGKLPSYLLPICAPLAMLSAGVLASWFDEQLPRGEAGQRWPEVRWTLMIGTLLFLIGTVGGIWHFFGPGRLVWASGLVLASIMGMLTVMGWARRSWRPALLALFIASWSAAWIALGEAEDTVLAQTSSIPAQRRAFGPDGWRGRTAVYQLNDAMIYWDQQGALERFDTPEALSAGIEAGGGAPVLVMTRANGWDRLEVTSPELHARGRIVGHWTQWPGAPVRYLVLF